METKSRRKIFISSPLKSNGLFTFEENLEFAKKLCRCVIAAGYLPIAAHVYCPQFLDVSQPDERELGMEFSLELLRLCDEIWIYSRHGFSGGMRRELEEAQKAGLESREWPEIYLPENIKTEEAF